METGSGFSLLAFRFRIRFLLAGVSLGLGLVSAFLELISSLGAFTDAGAGDVLEISVGKFSVCVCSAISGVELLLIRKMIPPPIITNKAVAARISPNSPPDFFCWAISPSPIFLFAPDREGRFRESSATCKSLSAEASSTSAAIGIAIGTGFLVFDAS